MKNNWYKKDPVLEKYQNLFQQSNVSGITLDEARRRSLLTEVKKRGLHKIPPGYKDSGKPDKGIGDFIIWETIKEIGKQKTIDIVFVSGEEKSDWFHKGDNKALFPRMELLYEFFDYTNGQNFMIVDFPTFLKANQASEQTIEEVKLSESWEESDDYLISKHAVFEWLAQNKSAVSFTEDPGPIMYIADCSGGKKIGFEIIVEAAHEKNPIDITPDDIIPKVAMLAHMPEDIIDEAMLFIVFPYYVPELSQQVFIGSFINILKRAIRTMPGSKKVKVVCASLTTQGNLRIY